MTIGIVVSLCGYTSILGCIFDRGKDAARVICISLFEPLVIRNGFLDRYYAVQGVISIFRSRAICGLLCTQKTITVVCI